MLWCAGAIAWHVFTGRPLYEGPLTDQDILGMLLGITPMPFEEDPTQWVAFDNHHVRLGAESPSMSCHAHAVAPLARVPVMALQTLARLSVRALGAQQLQAPRQWTCMPHAQAAHLVQGLLTRRPEERLTASAALAKAQQL